MMDRGSMKRQVAKPPMKGKFKPCSKCPSPAKCKAAGKCLMKSKMA